MNRLVIVLLSVLIVLVAITGFFVWWTGVVAHDDAERAHRDAVIAHEDAQRQNCIQQAEATAVIAQLAPPGQVDTEGRLNAMATLGAQVDDC